MILLKLIRSARARESKTLTNLLENSGLNTYNIFKKLISGGIPYGLIEIVVYTVVPLSPSSKKVPVKLLESRTRTGTRMGILKIKSNYFRFCLIHIVLNNN